MPEPELAAFRIYMARGKCTHIYCTVHIRCRKSSCSERGSCLEHKLRFRVTQMLSKHNMCYRSYWKGSTLKTWIKSITYLICLKLKHKCFSYQSLIWLNSNWTQLKIGSGYQTCTFAQHNEYTYLKQQQCLSLLVLV